MITEGVRLRVGVVFRKQVSDGNYGTEAAEIQLEAYFDDAEDDEEQLVKSLMMAARRYVHNELGRSPSLRVRQAVPQPQPQAVASGPVRDWVDEATDEEPF